MDLKVEFNDSILKITLNRVRVHNAFDANLIKDLTKAFKGAHKNHGARAILLSGLGPSFCSGGDLNWMKSMVKYSKSANQKDAEQLFEMYQSALDCPLPIVGYVHGHVFGGGLGLAAVCDIVAADISTKFCFSEVKIGIAPAVISSFVTRKMQMGKAREYMITGRVFDADEAFRSGLVQYVGRELEAKAFAEDTAKAFLKVGPEAVMHTKKLLNELSGIDTKSVRARCTKLIADRRVSREGQEGMKAFLSKTKPSWYIADDPKN